MHFVLGPYCTKNPSAPSCAEGLYLLKGTDAIMISFADVCQAKPFLPYAELYAV